MIKGLNTLLYAKLLSDDTNLPNGTAIYEPYKKLAGAIEIKPKLNQNAAELYSDDALIDSDYSVSSVGLTLTVDDDDDDIFCPIIGMTTDGENYGYDASVYDESIQIAIGYIEVKGRGKYRVKFFPNTKVKPFDSDAKTKEEKVTFQKTSIEVIASPLKNGVYKHQQTFVSSAAAISYLKYLFNNITPARPGITYDEQTQTLIIPGITYNDETQTLTTSRMVYDDKTQTLIYT